MHRHVWFITCPNVSSKATASQACPYKMGIPVLLQFVCPSPHYPFL